MIGQNFHWCGTRSPALSNSPEKRIDYNEINIASIFGY